MGDPSRSATDAVRFLVGDTNEDRVLLDDKEIAFAISLYPDQNLAAAHLAEHLFGVFSAKGSISVGPVSKDFGKVAEMFKQKAAQLRAEACLSAVPSFPATRVQTRNALDDDPNLTRPAFQVGFTDNPFAIQIDQQLDGTRNAF